MSVQTGFADFSENSESLRMSEELGFRLRHDSEVLSLQFFETRDDDKSRVVL